MSIRAQTAVWDSDLSHDEKYIALALADWADDDGNNIYPSVDRLAWKTGYSEREVRRCIKSMRDQHILELQGRTEWNTNLYQIVLDRLPKREPYKPRMPGRPEKLGATTPELGATTPELGATTPELGAKFSGVSISNTLSNPLDKTLFPNGNGTAPSSPGDKNGDKQGKTLLEPSSAAEVHFLDRLSAEAHAKRRHAITRFPTLAAKEQFDKIAEKVPDLAHLDALIDKALRGTGGYAMRNLLAYMAKVADVSPRPVVVVQAQPPMGGLVTPAPGGGFWMSQSRGSNGR